VKWLTPQPRARRAVLRPAPERGPRLSGRRRAPKPEQIVWRARAAGSFWAGCGPASRGGSAWRRFVSRCGRQLAHRATITADGSSDGQQPANRRQAVCPSQSRLCHSSTVPPGRGPATALRAGPRGGWSHLSSDRRRYEPVAPPHGWGWGLEERESQLQRYEPVPGGAGRVGVASAIRQAALRASSPRADAP
jgi:hypothetical protein